MSSLSIGTYVAFCSGEQQRIFYGCVETVDTSDPQNQTLYCLRIGIDAFKDQIHPVDVIQLPEALVAAAKAQLNTPDSDQVKAFISSGITILATSSSPALVAAASIAGTGGAAATTSGLFNLGLGSMAGGVVVIAAAPSALGVVTLRQISQAIQNDTITSDISTIGGVVGAITGTGASIGAISAAGSVAGLSSWGITSGLAALGGGTVASGGLGMVGGLLVVGGIALSGVAIIGGATFLIASHIRQQDIKNAFLRKRDSWLNEGIQAPEEIVHYH